MSAQTIKQFEGPNRDNDAWFARLPEQDQQNNREFVERANAALQYVRKNGVPEEYKGAAERYADFVRQNVAEGADRANVGAVISDEIVYAIDQTVAQVIYDNDVFTKIMQPVSRSLSNPRWEIKDYLLKSFQWPAFGRFFRSTATMRLAQTSAITQGIGMSLAYQMAWTEIEESRGGLWDPLAELARKCAERFGLQKQRRGFLGTSCLNAIGEDGSAPGEAVTGLHNYGSIQTVALGAASNNSLVAAGDVATGIRQLLTLLRNVRQPGDLVLITTPGVYQEAMSHFNTYQPAFNDLWRIKIDYFGYGSQGMESDQIPQRVLSEWWVTDDLYAGAAGVTHQRMMIFVRSPMLLGHYIIYPQQTVSVLNGKFFEKDISEEMLFADAIVIKQQDTNVNAVPLATSTADCTTTYTGLLGKSMRVL